TVMYDTHGTGNLPILLLQDTHFCLDRNIFLAEEFNVIANISQIGSIKTRIELIDIRTFHQLSIELIRKVLNWRKNIQTKIVETIFEFLIFGVAGHFNLTPASIFTDRRLKFTEITKPLD